MSFCVPTSIRPCTVLPLLALLFTSCATPSMPQSNPDELRLQVIETEKSFAQTMASRDFSAFASFLADETIFFSGSGPLRGKEQVAAAWKPFFEGATAPFSWEPNKVEVLDSGILALSTGPVYDPNQKLIASYTSIWRREQSGQWKIVFDKGNPVMESK